MQPDIREARKDELETLFPLLLLAEPSASALRWGLKNMSDTVYRMDVDGELVGAATMRWRRDPCEMLELAILRERQGEGLGKRFVAWLVAEARRRGKPEIIVGTSTTSAANIIFYQKCGFRADHVRQDYFWYYDEPVRENGLVVRDMLVFRLDLAAPEQEQAARTV
ncbi:MAG TPA: GNAT family N-acetyltransferase [Pyrinomonadaceae bacterium]|jgi:N-acetylglutamate synthase-like GNAT family acetyltransferase|nr:GNAT family N-acetyltransferase [Pyrinomonadaceae bacterium]